MTSCWRVLIVEDDPAVAFVHRGLLGRVAGFSVVGTATSAEDASELLPRTQPHLILLDLSLRGMNGATFLRRVRASGSTVEVIAVTASSDALTVRSLVHLGVVDYLVKPFSPERLMQALVLFRHRMSVLHRGDLSQAQVDEVSASGRLPRRWVPKGLSEDTVIQVRDALCAQQSEVSAEELSASLGLARVTTRRYLEYLTATHQAVVHARANGPGRPTKTYEAIRYEDL